MYHMEPNKCVVYIFKGCDLTGFVILGSKYDYNVNKVQVTQPKHLNINT